MYNWNPMSKGKERELKQYFKVLLKFYKSKEE